VLSITSNCASGKGSASTTAFLNDTSIPALRALRTAREIISGDASTPKTLPSAPTRCLATIASVPVPHPMLSTDAPTARCAGRRSCSRKARSLRCVKKQVDVLYALSGQGRSARERDSGSPELRRRLQPATSAAHRRAPAWCGPEDEERRAHHHARTHGACAHGLIADELARIPARGSNTRIPSDLIARHVASTFVLVLNW